MRRTRIKRLRLESAPGSQKPRSLGAWLRRGTEESNLALRFWRPRGLGIWASKDGGSRTVGIALGIEASMQQAGRQAPGRSLSFSCSTSVSTWTIQAIT
jgi:hypothetical protein